MSPKRRESGQPKRPVERILLRPSEAAEALGISLTKLYTLIKSGEIPSVLVGKSHRVPADWLRNLGRRWRRPPEDPQDPPA